GALEQDRAVGQDPPPAVDGDDRPVLDEDHRAVLSRPWHPVGDKPLEVVAPPGHPGIWASSGNRSHTGTHSGRLRPTASAFSLTSAAKTRRTSSLSRSLSR